MESVALDPRPAKYLTVADAAKRLNMTPRNVRYMIHSGKLDGRYEQTARGPIWQVSLKSLVAYEKARSQPKP
jgi:hypothetical protein